MLSSESALCLDEPKPSQLPPLPYLPAQRPPRPISLFPAVVESAKETRRKRRATFQLAPINLGSARLSASNESLNSSGSVSVSLSDCDEPSVSLAQSPLDESPAALGPSSKNPISSASSADEFAAALEKRQRLSSYSSGLSRHTSPVNLTVNGVDDDEISISNGYDDLAELECSSQGSTSAKCFQQIATGGLVIVGDDGEEFELVGDGRECKAVNIGTNTMYHCQVMKADEYKKFLLVVERAMLAKKYYSDDEYAIIKDLLIPDSVRPIPGDGNNLWYVLLPDHQGYLHSLVQSPDDTLHPRTIFSERQIQPIFKQIVSLVEFCHRIGLYFHDFRLRKFVFVDKERNLIRLHSVLDLYVADDIGNDSMSSRHVCPAYVSPEILDTKAGGYAGRPADIWALGVLLFILLTGRYPFYESNPNPMALFRRIKARRFSFPINENISVSARWLLNGLLRPNPLERPTAAEVLDSHWIKTEAELLPDGHTNQIPIISKSNRARRALPSSFFAGSPPAFQSFSATVISPSGSIRATPAIATRRIAATSQAPLQQAPGVSSAASNSNAFLSAPTPLQLITYRRFPIQYGTSRLESATSGEDQLVPDVPEERILESNSRKSPSGFTGNCI